jgi:hypothetical protein
LDYLGSSCPKLQLEPQRTNKITYSENQGPTGTNWYPSTTWTVTNNTVISPDGTQNADTLTETTSTGFHSGYFNATIESSYTGTYTISAFAKYNGRLFILNPFDTGAGRTYFNLQTGTVAQAGTGVTASMVDYGNGWYRCICTATFSAQTVTFEHMLATAVGTPQYTGNGTSGVHIFGCQAEAGAYATSYIPTTSAAVTRLEDKAEKTSASGIIGQTEGTIFWEVDIKIASAFSLEAIVNIDNGSFGNTLYIYQNSGAFSAEMYNAGVVQAAFLKAGITNGVYKCALAYANNNTAFFINGVQVGGTDTSCSVPATNRIQLGRTALSSDTSWTKQLLLFKTRLTNAQLAELTTL